MNFKIALIIFAFICISFSSINAFAANHDDPFSIVKKATGPTPLEKAINDFNVAIEAVKVEPKITKIITNQNDADSILNASRKDMTSLYREVSSGFITLEGFQQKKKAIIKNLLKIKVASADYQTLKNILHQNLTLYLIKITDESEKTLIRIASRECTDDVQSLDAETNCDLFVDFYTGVELVGGDNFSEAFPRLGLRLRSEIYQFRQDFYFNQKKYHLTKRSTKLIRH